MPFESVIVKASILWLKNAEKPRFYPISPAISPDFIP